MPPLEDVCSTAVSAAGKRGCRCGHTNFEARGTKLCCSACGLPQSDLAPAPQRDQLAPVGFAASNMIYQDPLPGFGLPSPGSARYPSTEEPASPRPAGKPVEQAKSKR